MSTEVGSIHYDVTLETGKMIEAQRNVEKELGKTTASLDKFDAKLSQITSAIKIYAAAMAMVKAANLADEIRLLGSRVEVAAGNFDSGTVAMQRLIAISRQTQTSVAANVEVFTRLNQSILAMGGTQNDTLRITDLLGKAIKVSGASAVEAKSAMVQFGQALGSGKLSGDELRALLETAPYLMKQLADGLGVPIGALKKLGEEGKLTSDVVVNALSKAATKIEADFAKFPQTLGGAFTVAKDSAERANEKFDQLSGTSKILTGATKGVGEVLDKLADQFAEANTEAGKLGNGKLVDTWADRTKKALSYVADAGDGVKRIFQHIGMALGAAAASASAVAKGQFSEARAVIKELDADLDKLWNEKLSGQKMRDLWDAGAGGGRGVVNPQPAASTLTPTGDEKKKTAKFDTAGYLAGLESAATEGFARIDAIEQAGLAKNAELLAKKKINAEQSAKAITLIEQRAAKDRLDLQDGLDKEIKDALERNAELEENKARARAQTAILLTENVALRTMMIHDEEVRQAEVAYQRGLSTFEEKELAKLKAARKVAEERQRIEKSAMDYAAGVTRAVNPIDALRQEYEAKLQLVTQYEQLMAQAGVDAAAQGEIARTQIATEYEAQRRALAEQSFRSQSEANAFLMDSVNALAGTATNAIMGLINGTMSAQDAMKSLATTVLNEAVNALVQMGVQQIKNALLSNTLAAADTARKATLAAVYTASVSAQVAGMSSLAAMNAFAATAAIPMVGPYLAPAAAAAAGATAMALGAPAIATAPIAGARQYGGPVSAGSLYRVNEGGSPEMFQAANGNQFLMPNKSGEVLPAGKGGAGGVHWTINVHPTLGESRVSLNDKAQIIDIAVGRAKSEIAGEFASNSGQVWGALRSSSSVKSRL